MDINPITVWWHRSRRVEDCSIAAVFCAEGWGLFKSFGFVFRGTWLQQQLEPPQRWLKHLRWREFPNLRSNHDLNIISYFFIIDVICNCICSPPLKSFSLVGLENVLLVFLDQTSLFNNFLTKAARAPWWLSLSAKTVREKGRMFIVWALISITHLLLLLRDIKRDLLVHVYKKHTFLFRSYWRQTSQNGSLAQLNVFHKGLCNSPPGSGFKI